MILNTVNIRDKIDILSFFERESEDALINLKTNQLELQSSKFKLTLDIEVEDTLNIDGFYVELRYFLLLVRRYENLTLDSNLKFSSDGENFNIPTKPLAVEEDIDLMREVFDLNESILLTEQTIGNISVASSFAETVNLDFSGIILNQNYTASGNKLIFYDAQNDQAVDSKLILNDYIYFTIKKLKDLDTPLHILDNVHSIVLISDDLTLESAKIIKSSLPDINDTFRAKYLHSSHFTVTRDDLREALKFLSPFTKDIFNERIILSFRDNALVISVESSIYAEQCITVLDKTFEFSDETIVMFRNKLANIIEAIDDEVIQFNIDLTRNEDKQYVKPVFSITGKKNKQHTVITMMQK